MTLTTGTCILFAAAIGLVLCLRAMIRLRPRHSRSHADDAGVATMEFALVMPVVLFLILILTQTALLMAGQLFVHYAAFAAARVAIVQVPRDLTQTGGEPRNVIDLHPGSPKFDAIERAAQFAVMPVSGRDVSNRIDPSAFTHALRRHFELLGQAAPPWVDTLAGERMAYAVEHTGIELMTLDGHDLQPLVGFHEYQPRETLTVRVAHRFNLSVPYVRAIFADGYHQTRHGETAYTLVHAVASLTVEGTDTALPVEPSIPRRDRRITASS